VKAALLSISAMNVLRNQTLPAPAFTSPAQVLVGLNEAFQMERHNGLYFTMLLAVYNKQKRQIACASGGHPPAILMAGDTLKTATPAVAGACPIAGLLLTWRDRTALMFRILPWSTGSSGAGPSPVIQSSSCRTHFTSEVAEN
jgi:hypothetical protein